MRFFTLVFLTALAGAVYGLGDTPPAPPAPPAPAPAPAAPAEAPAEAAPAGGGGWTLRAPMHLSQRVYDLGERAFEDFVVCRWCVFAGLELTQAAVARAWPDIEREVRPAGRIGKRLTRAERRALKLYVRKRFGD